MTLHTAQDHSHDLDLHDMGLAYDLRTIGSISRPGLSRRNALKLLGGASLVALAACGSAAKSAATSAATNASTTGAPTASTAAAATTAVAGGTPPAGGNAGPPPGGRGSGGMAGTQPADGTIPQETAGPYPGDGTNGPNALTNSGIVRSDITPSLTSNVKATGVPLTIKLKLTTGVGGAPLVGAAVYTWHCDQLGRYSMYSAGVENDTHCRGVQVTGANGEVTFISIYPAAYSGRWPHVHYEVYKTVADATSAGTPISISQLAMPDATNTAVFATKGYEQSITNYAGTSLATDGVFADGADKETPAITGDVTAGYVATLTVPVAV